MIRPWIVQVIPDNARAVASFHTAFNVVLERKRQPIPTFHGFDVTCDTTGPVQNVGIGENGRGVIRGA